LPVLITIDCQYENDDEDQSGDKTMIRIVPSTFDVLVHCQKMNTPRAARFRGA